MWFPNRSDTNRAVQAQKRARSLKFWIKVEEELYYPSSENKGADQLRGYREADLRLCFRLCRLLVFPWGGSNIFRISETGHRMAKGLSCVSRYYGECSIDAQSEIDSYVVSLDISVNQTAEKIQGFSIRSLNIAKV